MDQNISYSSRAGGATVFSEGHRPGGDREGRLWLSAVYVHMLLKSKEITILRKKRGSVMLNVVERTGICGPYLPFFSFFFCLFVGFLCT